MKRIFILFLCLVFVLSSTSCYRNDNTNNNLGNGWVSTHSMELKYATQFAIDYYKDGFKLITLSDGNRFLVIPEGKTLPENIKKDITPLYQPLENIYIAAVSSMCHFDLLESLDKVRLSGTKKNGWYLENVKKAMENDDIIYAGKYNHPDYEIILDNNCSLAIESTMINHAPDVIEKLKNLGVLVLIDRSSFEPHPLGRAEWIKLYASLLNEEEKAEKIFEEQVKISENIEKTSTEEKTVAFFHITPAGSVVIRKSDDYIVKMIELAGGEYIFSDFNSTQSKTATENIEMEIFYNTAKDADIIIYNTTMYGDLKNTKNLIDLNHLLSDFKAVQTGNVWCTKKNMFQETAKLGEIIKDFGEILSDNINEETNYFYKLK